MTKYFFGLSFFIFLMSATAQEIDSFSEAEKSLILSEAQSKPMRVYQITDSAELKVLKNLSKEINPKDSLISILANRMRVTVEAEKGVGIAAPQVGINKKLIWVQRFDKADFPFEFYINPKIIWRSDLLQKGREGCLSIPDIVGNIFRNYIIQIQYQDSEGKIHQENIEGFTAVIFQHEIDHLEGILFTQREEEQASMNFIRLSEGELYLEN